MAKQRERLPASQGDRIAAGELAQHNVFGAFPSMDAARQAIHALGLGTIEADAVSLIGPGPDEAAAQQEQRRTDARIITYWAGRVAIGAAAGAVVGALAGVPLGFALPVISDFDADAGSIALTVFLAALALSAVGGLIAHVYALQPSRAFELTFNDTNAGLAYGGVHSNKPEDIELAEDILRRQHPLDLYRLDQEGRRV